MEFSSSSPYSHIQIAMWIFAMIVSPNKPEVNVVDLRLDVFRFVAKKQASQKDSLFCLKFAMKFCRSAKSGNFKSIKRVLVNGYFIVKYLCYIYRQLDSHFKLCYCYDLNIADTF